MAGSTAWLIVFDGFADWQTALACHEIRRQPGHCVRTAAPELAPILSQSGLRVTPDTTLDRIGTDDACVLLLPGGDFWEAETPPVVTELLRAYRTAEIPIAAICTGTLPVARAGLLGSTRHTSNGLAWLKARVPEYRDDAYYVNVMDVSDGGLITANAAGHVDFAHEIIKSLGLMDEPERRAWYRLHREGALPPGV